MQFTNMEQLEQRNIVPARHTTLPFSIMFAAVVLSGTWIYTAGLRAVQQTGAPGAGDAALHTLEDSVLPADGFELPLRWGDMGHRLVEAGVIDKEKFLELYADRGGLTAAEEQLLLGTTPGNLRITQQNAGILLNLLWAFGLGNKNPVLTSGPMTDPAYGGADNFASTGGWTIADGDAMDHYAKYAFVTLTTAQQQMVERVAKGIFRPCCGNSTYFPDCNHGMAMLGFLELLAAQGADEATMYRSALAVNSFWFPDTYLTIAQYEEQRGIHWKDVDARTVLGANFSSASGFSKVRASVEPATTQPRGGSCGV